MSDVAPALEPVEMAEGEYWRDGCASWMRGLAYHMLLFGCRASGAAFIKWGQWASSRPDMLPPVRQS